MLKATTQKGHKVCENVEIKDMGMSAKSQKT